MTDVLLATCPEWPRGEPGAASLDAALAARGISASWAVWHDPDVDWAQARLVAVRSTWDYVPVHGLFTRWVADVERTTPVLNGRDVFRWNIGKDYLTRLTGPVVPTILVTDREVAARAFGTTVFKPCVGAGGRGVVVVEGPEDPRLGELAEGPLVAQPFGDSVRTEGEVSVFVIDGRPVSQVRKVPAAGEIRAHERRGAVVRAEPLGEEQAWLAMEAWHDAGEMTGHPLDYARIDMLRVGGTWCVSEIEATEPGLYLDLVPANAEAFADLVAARLRG